MGGFCPVPSCPGAPKDGGSGYPVLVPCHLGAGTPLSLAMPLSHQHSPPQALPMHGSGFGFSISSSANPAFPLPLDSCNVPISPPWRRFWSGCQLPWEESPRMQQQRVQTETPTHASTHQQPKPGRGVSLLSPPWVQDLAVPGQTLPTAGPAHPWLHGWGSRSDALGGYRGLCPAAVGPLGHPTGMWESRGDRGGCAGALGVFFRLWRCLGWGLAGSSVDGGSAPAGVDSGGRLGPAEHRLWISFLEHCRL